MEFLGIPQGEGGENTEKNREIIYDIYIYIQYTYVYIYIDIHISIISMKYGEKINQLYIYI
jgi:hypothetical protein